jgi:hypothetical protein
MMRGSRRPAKEMPSVEKAGPKSSRPVSVMAFMPQPPVVIMVMSMSRRRSTRGAFVCGEREVEVGSRKVLTADFEEVFGFDDSQRGWDFLGDVAGHVGAEGGEEGFDVRGGALDFHGNASIGFVADPASNGVGGGEGAGGGTEADALDAAAEEDVAAFEWGSHLGGWGVERPVMEGKWRGSKTGPWHPTWYPDLGM